MPTLLLLSPQRSPLSALQNLICCEMQKGFRNNRMTDSEKSILYPFVACQYFALQYEKVLDEDVLFDILKVVYV